MGGRQMMWNQLAAPWLCCGNCPGAGWTGQKPALHGRPYCSSWEATGFVGFCYLKGKRKITTQQKPIDFYCTSSNPMSFDVNLTFKKKLEGPHLARFVPMKGNRLAASLSGWTISSASMIPFPELLFSALAQILKTFIPSESVLWLITCLLTALGSAKKQVECTCCSWVMSELQAGIFCASEEC